MSDTPETVKQIPPADVIFLASEQASDLPNNELWTRAELRDFIIEAIMLDRSRRPSSEAGQALVGVPFVTADLMVAGRIDGMGNPDPQGSYLWFILDRKDGAPTHYKISEGAADLAASTIRTALQPGHKP